MVDKCPQSISIRVPELYVDGKWVPTIHDLGWLVAAFFALCATSIAAWLMWMHAAYYHKPWEQRHVARILLMLPIYSIISLLSYVFYPWAMAYNTISSAYEAFALCSFFLLLRTYLDPDVRGLKHDLRLRNITYWAWPLSYDFVKRWLYLSPMNGLTWYNIVSFGISQYAILRPTLAIVSIVLNHYELFCETTLSPIYGNFYVFVLQSISVAVAMYCVVAFYLELKEEPALRRNRPLLKLTCIKLVIFLIFWQGIALQLLTVAGVIKDLNQYWSSRDIQTGLNALITCVEMAIFAVLHISAFTYKDYVPDDLTKTTHRWKLIVDAFNFMDFVREFIKACKWLFSERRIFDPDGFDVERDDAVYQQLRLKRLRKSRITSRSTSNASPIATHTVTVESPTQEKGSPACSPRSQATHSRMYRSISTGELLLPPPKLRVLQTRSRSSSTNDPPIVGLFSSNLQGAALPLSPSHSSLPSDGEIVQMDKRILSKSDRILGR